MGDSSIMVRSFAKINLGLKIGRLRPDGFHELRTVYQTIALHDVVHVDVQPGSGIEIRCDNPRVPLDESNTCYKVAERVLAAEPQGLKPCPEAARSGTAKAVPFQTRCLTAAAEAVPLQGKLVIQIDKRLPVQGGLGAASSNAVATMFGLERALGIELHGGRRVAHCRRSRQRSAVISYRRNGVGRRTRRGSLSPARPANHCIWWWSRRPWEFRRLRPLRAGTRWQRGKLN